MRVGAWIDIDVVYDFLVEIDENAAHKELTKILARIEGLKFFPKTGSPVIISTEGILRQVNVSSYRILYVVHDEESFVEVHGIEHMKQKSRFID